MSTTLRQARKKRSLTLAEVARSVGTDVGNLSRIEHDQTPSKALAKRLHEFYEGEVSMLEILHICENRQEEAA